MYTVTRCYHGIVNVIILAVLYILGSGSRPVLSVAYDFQFLSSHFFMHHIWPPLWALRVTIYSQFQHVMGSMPGYTGEERGFREDRDPVSR
jgi:hypothetical protein